MCYGRADAAPFKVCKGCGAMIHLECAKREARRPEHQRLNHTWTENVVGGGKTVAADLEAGPDVDDLLAEITNSEQCSKPFMML
ncbi:MAG: hypothetical protein P4L69_15605 [Desulfosporosinus sp.]|nr:hypothetical protein [Desulfosporosinus sp.]